MAQRNSDDLFQKTLKHKTNLATEMAVAQVDANANQGWKDAALQAVYEVCVRQATFFADDVWDHFKAVWGEFATNGTHEMRAMGPVVRRASALGWCRCTKDYRRVRGSHNHLRPVWESLIFRGQRVLEQRA